MVSLDIDRSNKKTKKERMVEKMGAKLGLRGQSSVYEVCGESGGFSLEKPEEVKAG